LASQLAGSFTLPAHKAQKLAFIAGGVGITPFRSMVKNLVDSGDTADWRMLYCVNTPAEAAYGELFRQATGSGLSTRLVITGQVPPDWRGARGPLDGNLISSSLPDYAQRTFYVSGPQGFVAAVRHSLVNLGVSRRRIITDFFPGYN